MSTKLTSKEGNPFWRLLMLVLAFTVMPFYEAAKWLSNKVYRGWAGSLRALFGVGLGVAAGIVAGHYVRSDLGYSTWLWLPSGLIGFAATIWYAWPVAYLIAVKPLMDLAEWYAKGVRKFAENTFSKWTEGFINLLRKLPIADAPWDIVMKKGRNSWVMTLLYGVSYTSIILGSIYLGWTTYGHVLGLVHLGILSYALAALAGLAAGLFVVTTLWQFMEYGKISFIAIGTGIITVHTLSSTTGALLAKYGFPAVLGWPAYAVEFLLYTAYLFPIVNVVLTNGFWKWLIDQLKPLEEKVYEENKGNYRSLFHHLVNLAAAWRFTTLSLVLCAALHLGLPATIAVAALVALLSYTLVVKLIDHEGGNGIIGFLASAYVAWLAGKAYLAAGLWYGVYGAIVGGVAAGIATFLLVFPLVYLVFKAIAEPLLAGWLTGLLVGLHTAVYNQFKKLVDELGHVYEHSYRDKAPFKDLFLHLANLAATAGVGYLSLQMTQHLAVGSILCWTAVVLLAVLSYLLVGKLLLKLGMDALGAVFSLAASIHVGLLTYNAQAHGLWVAVPVGLAAGAFVAYLSFPIAYVVLRALTGWALVGWLLPALAGVYYFGWRLFMAAWEQFLSVYRFVKKLVTPFWRALVQLWMSVWKSIKDAWNSIGHRS